MAKRSESPNEIDFMRRNCGFHTFGNLFPTKASFIIFIAYMMLFVNQGIKSFDQ